jgi:hypothetical protein
MRGNLLAGLLILICCCASRAGYSQSTGSCSFTVSGGLTVSGSCIAVAEYSAVNKQTTVSITSTASQNSLPTTASCGFILDGQVSAPFSVTSSTGRGSCVVMVANSIPQAWLASRNMTGTADTGVFAVNVASLGTGMSNQNATAYMAPSGSVTATLLHVLTPDETPGSATLAITFQSSPKLSVPPGAIRNPGMRSPTAAQPTKVQKP